MGQQERRQSLPTSGGRTHKALNEVYGLLGAGDIAARCESETQLPDIRTSSVPELRRPTTIRFDIPETDEAGGPPVQPRVFLANWKSMPKRTEGPGRIRNGSITGDLRRDIRRQGVEFLAPLTHKLRSFAYFGTQTRLESPWAELTNSPLLTTPSRFQRDDSSTSLAADGDNVVNSSRFYMSEYRKLSRLLVACLVLGIGLAVYQEVVQHRGMSGCSPSVLWEFADSSALSSHCADVRLLHVFMPLAARQVRFLSPFARCPSRVLFRV